MNIESKNFPHPLSYKEDLLCFEHIPIESIVVDHHTPCYIYSLKNVKENYNHFLKAATDNDIFNPMVCFALKANNNIHILKHLQHLGCGADIVSGGELKRALLAGIDPKHIVFSGVGKNEHEITMALNAGEFGIYSFNVESIDELELINNCAKKMDIKANIAFRLNPKVNAKTHKHISTGNKSHKFGLIDEDIKKAIANTELWNHCNLKGLSIHIGSQLTELSATKKAIAKICELALELLPNQLEFIDVGGGLGIPYESHLEEKMSTVEDYMKVTSTTIQEHLYDKLPEDYPRPRIVFEPGRVIVGRAGVFATKVIRSKQSEDHHFTIVDGGMNDFARPALYDAIHHIYPYNKASDFKQITTNIVGPICETADYFGISIKLPKCKAGDILVIADTGAYGHTMASHYNMRDLPNEIIIPKIAKEETENES